jgi:hypothetical protein
VPLQPGGFYLAAVPRHLWVRLDGSAGPARVLDASGAAIDAGCVQWYTAPASTPGDVGTRGFYSSGDAESCRPAPPLMGPSSLRVDVARAQKLVEFRTRSKWSIYPAGTDLALWRAPANHGLVCTYIDEVPLRRDRGFQMGGGGSCSDASQPQPPAGGPPIRYRFSVGPAGVFEGEVSPAAGIVRMGFRTAAGEEPLAFEHGFFIGQLPDGDVHAGELPPGGPFLIVGYAADGHVVARLDVEKTIGKASGGSS